MYLDYCKTVLDVSGVSEAAKIRIAERLERWAKENDIENQGQIHEKLDDMIQGALSEGFVELNKPIGEDIDLQSLIADPRAKTPPEILIAGSESLMSASELQQFISEESPELAEAASTILGPNSEAVYRQGDLDPEQIQHRLRAIVPRIRNRKLLVPDKQVVSVGFDNGNLKIRYRTGYPDERIQRVIEGRFRGMILKEVAGYAGISIATASNWLRSMGCGKREMIEERKKQIVEYVERYFADYGMGPIVLNSKLDENQLNDYKELVEEEKIDRIAVFDIYRGGHPRQMYLPLKKRPTKEQLKSMGLYLYNNFNPVYDFISSYFVEHGAYPTASEVRNSFKFRINSTMSDAIVRAVRSTIKVKGNENKLRVYSI